MSHDISMVYGAKLCHILGERRSTLWVKMIISVCPHGTSRSENIRALCRPKKTTRKMGSFGIPRFREGK